MSALGWDAIVVAGGRATRLGGVDKTALVYRGHSLLDGVLDAVADAQRVCVVGSDTPLPRTVLRAVEQPRWGGPAAAIVAGLGALAGAGAGGGGVGAGGSGDGGDSAQEPRGGADWIVVLAADLVRADEAVVVLLAALTALHSGARIGAPDGITDGVIGVHTGGRRQPLLAVYRRAALASAAAAHGTAANLSVKRLIEGLNLVELSMPDELGDDVDTAADAARLGIQLPGPASAPDGAGEPGDADV